MSDILIKNMNMPESCDKCGLCDVVYCNSYRFCSLDFYRETRSPDCPLVEIKPHGRLIDADELEKCGEIVKQDQGYYCVKGIALTSIYNAPTIIEAEET